ncbi:MAG: hypothetical protein WCB68_01240, partial [Pyrinomonadaceae bacterium]
MRDENRRTNSEHEVLNHERHHSSFRVPRSSFNFIPHPSSLIPFLVVLLVLLYGVVYPNLHLLTASLESGGRWSLANYALALQQRAVFEAAWNSLGVS